MPFRSQSMECRWQVEGNVCVVGRWPCTPGLPLFCATHRFIPRFLVLTQSGNMMEKT